MIYKNTAPSDFLPNLFKLISFLSPKNKNRRARSELGGIMYVIKSFNYNLPALPNTFSILCLYNFSMLSRAGPKYLRGSNSAGFVANTSRIAAVIAKRLSESMLILQTADLAALRNSSSGIPIAASNFPPYLLIVSTSSWGTEDEPCNTMGKPGSFSITASNTSNAKGGGTKRPVLGST